MRRTLCCLVASATAFAKEKQPKSYPEHGTIIATKTSAQVETEEVTTDKNGKVHGGDSITWHYPVYRIETDTRIYELEALTEKRAFSVGDVVHFRLEKRWAYVQYGDKEKRVRVITVELKPPTR